MMEVNARTLRRIVDLARDEEITFLAAAIAYYAFVSLIPALLLALAIASSIGGEILVNQVLAASTEYLTPSAQEALSDTLQNIRGRSGATFIGLMVLVWTMLRVFRGLDIAFSRVYGTGGTQPFVDQFTDAVVVVIAIGFGIGAMVLVGTVLSATPLPAGAGLVGLGLLLLGLVLVFLPLYYVFPDRPVTVRSILPGTVFAAISWVVLQAGFQLYASVASRYELYGFIGGILLLVTWFYVAAIAILVGAALNAVFAGIR